MSILLQMFYGNPMYLGKTSSSIIRYISVASLEIGVMADQLRVFLYTYMVILIHSRTFHVYRPFEFWSRMPRNIRERYNSYCFVQLHHDHITSEETLSNVTQFYSIKKTTKAMSTNLLNKYPMPTTFLGVYWFNQSRLLSDCLSVEKRCPHDNFISFWHVIGVNRSW